MILPKPQCLCEPCVNVTVVMDITHKLCAFWRPGWLPSSHWPGSLPWKGSPSSRLLGLSMNVCGSYTAGSPGNFHTLVLSVPSAHTEIPIIITISQKPVALLTLSESRAKEPRIFHPFPLQWVTSHSPVMERTNGFPFSRDAPLPFVLLLLSKERIGNLSQVSQELIPVNSMGGKTSSVSVNTEPMVTFLPEK